MGDCRLGPVWFIFCCCCCPSKKNICKKKFLLFLLSASYKRLCVCVCVYVYIYKHTHTHSLSAIKASYKQLSARPLKGYLFCLSLSLSYTERRLRFIHFPGRRRRRRKCFGISRARPWPERSGETVIFRVPVLSTHTHTQSELEEITNKKEIEKFLNFGHNGRI